MDYADLARAVAPFGLRLRGGFHPRETDGVPPLDDAREARTVVLVGNAGPRLWQRFSASPQARDGLDHPLDRFSAHCLNEVAARYDAMVLLPSQGPPFFPFLRWAKRADTVWDSPIGPLIHPQFGLWHAYRGALVFAVPMTLPAPVEAANPCERCVTKPCLSTCPVSALGPEHRYDVAACRSFVASSEGEDCLTRACAARRACPIGKSYQYPPQQATLHMRSFAVALGSNR